MATVETPEQALARIQARGFGRNDAMCIMAFADRGIPAEDIDPRNNVLTFRAWKAKGRQVAKGATGVPVTTWIPCKDSSFQTPEGEKPKSKLRPKTARLFHVSQTIPSNAPKGTRPAAWKNPALVKSGTYEATPEPVADAEPEPWTEATPLAQVDAEMREQLTGEPVQKEMFGGPLFDSPTNDRRSIGDLTPECTCPMAGVVTNVDCPLHGKGVKS